MRAVIFGKHMPFPAVRPPGHKKEIVRGIRVQSRLYGILAGSSNGSGRQALNNVSIIGVLILQKAAVDFSLIPVSHAVNHCGIRLELHSLSEPVDKHRGNLRPFGADCGFLFDNGGHNKGFVGRSIRKVCITALPFLLQKLLTGLVGSFKHGNIGISQTELIGVCQKKSLGIWMIGNFQKLRKILRLRILGKLMLKLLSALKNPENIADPSSLHQSDLIALFLAGKDNGQNLPDSGPGRDFIGAGLELRKSGILFKPEPEHPAVKPVMKNFPDHRAGAVPAFNRNQCRFGIVRYGKFYAAELPGQKAAGPDNCCGKAEDKETTKKTHRKTPGKSSLKLSGRGMLLRRKGGRQLKNSLAQAEALYTDCPGLLAVLPAPAPR